MIILQTTNNKWFCTNSVKVARDKAGHVFLVTDWVQLRMEEKKRALIANEIIEEAKSRGDKDAELNGVIDFLLCK